jgi:hypothetical protein
MRHYARAVFVSSTYFGLVGTRSTAAHLCRKRLQGRGGTRPYQLVQARVPLASAESLSSRRAVIAASRSAETETS